MKKIIKTSNAPQPKGPYHQAVADSGFVFVSGQGPIDPVTNQFVLGTIEEETALVFRNIRNILEAAGCTLSDVVKCNVYLADLADFAAMNGVYEKVFEGNPPARTTIGCRLLAGMKVEIDVIACKH